MKRRLLLTLGLCLLIVSFVATAQAQTPTLSVHFIDVGQGDSILVEAPGHNEMLVDASTSRAGSAVAEYLKQKGIDELEVLVCTHPHADHIGGLAAVFAACGIDLVIDPGMPYDSSTYRTEVSYLGANSIPFQYGRNGQQFDLAPGVTVNILGPLSLGNDPNNNSVALKVTYGATSFLLMGDAGFDEESQILAAQVNLRSDVLKVGHHGSATSTSESFLDAVEPRYGVISVGAGNSYGHPTASTLARLARHHLEVYRTDQDGTVIITSDGMTLTVQTVKTNSTGSTARASAGNGNQSAGSGAQGSYIGNINTKKFHRPSCSYLPELRNRAFFKTRDAALAAGYIPCKKCNP